MNSEKTFAVELAFWFTDEQGTADEKAARSVLYNHLFDALAQLRPAGFNFGWRGMDVTQVTKKEQ